MLSRVDRVLAMDRSGERKITESAPSVLLAEASLITNKNLIPSDRPEDWDRPGGLRIGTTEVTRRGMKQPEMEAIADLMTDVLIGRRAPQAVRSDAVALRRAFSRLHYCF